VASVQGLAGQLSGWASSAWDQARNAMVSTAESIYGWVAGIPGRIVGALGNLGGLLYGAGQAIITGFLNGLKAAAQETFDFVSGIAAKIADLKGPLPYDRVLLIPHGRAIMGGLNEGLRSQFPQVRSTLRELTNSLPNMTVGVKGTSLAPTRTASAVRNGIALTPALIPRPASTTTITRKVDVHAPITVQSPAESGVFVARRAADHVATLAQA
jgi:phage-related protein